MSNDIIRDIASAMDLDETQIELPKPAQGRRLVVQPEWQDIATAPKDGSEIILGREGRVMVGEYHVTMGRFTCWLTHHGQEHPTHWQPLPSPPTLKDTP